MPQESRSSMPVPGWRKLVWRKPVIAWALYDCGNSAFATSERRFDRVSAFGFSLGYAGGGILLAVHCDGLSPGWFGLADVASAVRVAFLTVAAWWGGLLAFNPSLRSERT